MDMVAAAAVINSYLRRCVLLRDEVRVLGGYDVVRPLVLEL